MQRRSLVIAGLVVLALVGWMASGLLRPEVEVASPLPAEPPPVLVQTRLSQAREIDRSLVVQGDALALRQTAVRSQVASRVEAVLVEEGDRIEEGEPLLRLALQDRRQRLRQAQARLEQREADLDAALELRREGFTPEERVRALRAELEAARADVAAIEREIEDLTIRAPFAGVVDDVTRRMGELVAANEEVATLLDTTPLTVEVRVPQQSIDAVEEGSPAAVRFATGRLATGRICRIAAAADPATRTFGVEIRLPNVEPSTPPGVSAEVRIPTGTIDAHFTTPANLSLDPQGRLGLKTVTEDDEVDFVPVEIAEANVDGVWVVGPGEEALIITRGQGFVRPGDPVRTQRAETPLSPPEARLDLGTPPPPAICDDATVTAAGTARTEGRGAGG